VIGERLSSEELSSSPQSAGLKSLSGEKYPWRRVEIDGSLMVVVCVRTGVRRISLGILYRCFSTNLKIGGSA